MDVRINNRRLLVGRRLAIYLDPDDRWIGMYKGLSSNFFCLFPCLVVKWKRKRI
jgi:hypothetical protein